MSRRGFAQYALLGLVTMVLVLSLSIGATVATGTVVRTATGTPDTTDLTTVFYGTTITSPQPSPFLCYPLICYTPQDLKAAYNYPSYLNGAGQTIVILDAYGSPTVQSDLNTFDSLFNLPPTTVQIVCQAGITASTWNQVGPCPTFQPNGWVGEIALDTQYSHAMAPAAHIVLFVMASADDLVDAHAIATAITMFPHSIISQSFGDPELDLLQGTCTQGEVPFVPCTPAYVHDVLSTSEAAYEQAAREGTTVFASAGDSGATNGYTGTNPSWPSDSPWVTAVGGTMGNPYYFGTLPTCSSFTCSTGLVNFLNPASCPLLTCSTATPVGYGGEQVWNEPWLPAAGGGAPSLIVGVPFYQYGLGLTMRATPDVSYNAAVSGGVLGVINGGLYIIGGTSAGSPQWAAIAALADQLASFFGQGTIGFINPELYEIGHTRSLYRADFHDITVGNNSLYGYPPGFTATRGWDDASGWGTPNVANLVPDLVFFSH